MRVVPSWLVVGVKTGNDIAALVSEIPGPVNVLAGSGGLSVAQLSGLGVRRISLGSTAFTESMTTVHRLAVELLSNGQATESDYGAIPNLNRIFQMNSVYSKNNTNVHLYVNFIRN